jgi:hypothetical protein
MRRGIPKKGQEFSLRATWPEGSESVETGNCFKIGLSTP